MSYPDWFNEILRCPETGKKLSYSNGSYCRGDGACYPVKNGILSIVYPKALSGEDEKMNKFYNRFAPIYDFNERVLGRAVTGVNMTKGRKEIISKLNLKPSDNKILEVSPGPGVFQKFLRDAVGEEGRIVSLDLSMAMLRQCQTKNGNLNIYLVQGNAQFLPFADESFDVLFHFGGVNLFNEPQKAISEFVRVTKKGGTVSWGDEGFSKEYSHNFRRKMLSKINPGFTKPKPAIPANVTNVEENAVYDGLGYLVVGEKA